MATGRTLNVQTPGAQPAAAPAQPPDDNEGLVVGAADLDMPKRDLPPDLQAVVAAEVAKALSAQKKADAAARTRRKDPADLPKHDEVVAAHQAKSMDERIKSRPVLTDKGWFAPPEYGSKPRGMLE